MRLLVVAAVLVGGVGSAVAQLPAGAPLKLIAVENNEVVFVDARPVQACPTGTASMTTVHVRKEPRDSGGTPTAAFMRVWEFACPNPQTASFVTSALNGEGELLAAS